MEHLNSAATISPKENYCKSKLTQDKMNCFKEHYESKNILGTKILTAIFRIGPYWPQKYLERLFKDFAISSEKI